MISPTVTEVPRRMEAITADSFITYPFGIRTAPTCGHASNMVWYDGRCDSCHHASLNLH